MKTPLEQEIELILQKPLEDLRKIHKELFPELPPPYFRKQAIGNIVYKLQEKEYGELATESKKKLDYLMDQMEKGKRISCTEGLLPGTKIFREYNGKIHKILVTDTGYVNEGQAFTSSSAVAFKITGTRWNGFKFLGLIKNNKQKVEGNE